MALVDKVVSLHRQLAAEGLAHAIGGAIALGYHAQPRGTVEIDLNVFVPPSEVSRVLSTVQCLGIGGPAEGSSIIPTAGVRCPWEETHVDFFFAYDPEFFGCVQGRVEGHLFFDSSDQEHVLPFLSAEDLVIFKVLFNRPKDWVDIRHILEARDIDVEYVEHWVLHLRSHTAWPHIRRLLDLRLEVRF